MSQDNSRIKHETLSAAVYVIENTFLTTAGKKGASEIEGRVMD